MVEIIFFLLFGAIGSAICLVGTMIGRKLCLEEHAAKRNNDLEQARYWLNVIAIQGGDIQEPWSAEIARQALHGARPAANTPVPPLLLTHQTSA